MGPQLAFTLALCAVVACAKKRNSESGDESRDTGSIETGVISGNQPKPVEHADTVSQLGVPMAADDQTDSQVVQPIAAALEPPKTCANGQTLKFDRSGWQCATDEVTTDAGAIATGTLADERLGSSVSRLGATIESAEITNGTISLADLGANGCAASHVLSFDGSAWVCSAVTDPTKLPVSGGTMTGTLAMPDDGLTVGSNQLVAENGNIGIGTANPTAKLEVAGAAGVDGIKFPDGTLQVTAFRAAYLSCETVANVLTLDSTSWSSLSNKLSFATKFSSDITRAGTKFTFKNGGIYRITASFNAWGTTEYVGFRMQKTNGTPATLLQRVSYSGSTESPLQQVAGLFQVAAGDQVDFQYTLYGDTITSRNGNRIADGETPLSNNVDIEQVR